MVQLGSNSRMFGIVLIRIVIGLLFVRQGWGHITAEDGVPNLVGGTDFSSPLFTWWGENLIGEHPQGASLLIAWLEFLCGIGLTLGALTRPLGSFVAFMMLCFALSGGRQYEAELAGLVGVCAFACAISGAGRIFGLDSIFDQHFPRWLTWARRAGD